MSVSAVLSYDVDPSAPDPTQIREGVRGIADTHATAGKWLLSHLLLLQFPNAGTFNAFGIALGTYHDQPGVSPYLDFVAIGWIDGTSDVFHVSRTRPPAGGAAAAPGAGPTPAASS